MISIEDLWKEYRLGVIGHGTLTHDLQSWWAKFRGKEDPNAMLVGQKKQVEGDRFWALRDINFDVSQGEVLGIIGKNGAGKSTLLKILSRVTAPTNGNIKVRGRIASLLEVGTGFHPELTGRENIYLNGAILGMSKKEVQKKIDEIIDFSGVEQHIDTPVKRYSSGMYVRLAFAVAAHLEPEILVVDEVLAVGDAGFQEQCLGKMGEVSREGRTILFVSHNMGAVEKLCSKVMIIDDGINSRPSNSVADGIDRYLDASVGIRSDLINLNDYKNEYHNILRFELCSDDSEGCRVFRKTEKVTLIVQFELLKIDREFDIGYNIYTRNNQLIYRSFFNDKNGEMLNVGVNTLETTVEAFFLNDGEYVIELISALHRIKWLLKPQVNAPRISFKVSGGSLDSNRLSSSKREGILFPLLNWKKINNSN